MNGRKVIILFVWKSYPTFAFKPFAENDTQTKVLCKLGQIQLKNKTYNLKNIDIYGKELISVNEVWF